MYSVTDKIIRNAKKVVRECATRDAARIARELEITVLPRDFKRQKGAYKVIERNPFIFIKRDLHPVLYEIVLLHEIGHDRNHKQEAIRAGGFEEFNIFDLQASRLEYEANLFASEVSLLDDDVLELIERLSPEILGETKGGKHFCANVDMNERLISLLSFNV